MTQLSASFVWTIQDKFQDTVDSEVFEKFHKLVVGHLECDLTYKALKFSGHNWMGMKDQLKKYIYECTICQKIKWQIPENGKDLVDHHLYSVSPLSEISIDTLGPLPEDECK